MNQKKIEISIVVPIYNEEESIELLNKNLQCVLKQMARTYECLYVDDGSSDNTAEIVRDLAKVDNSIRPIYLRRNFGQTAALLAGFDHAQGEIIVTLDADMQNDPKDIPNLIEKIESGYDLVTGWRQNRQDAWIRNFPSLVANRIISAVTGVYVRDSGCTLKAYRRDVVVGLQLYGEMHRFIPALASWKGIQLLEIPVSHHARQYGKSKYGMSRIFRVMLDLFTVKFLLSYSASPIQMFGSIGIGASFLGFMSLIAVFVLKVLQDRTLTGNPLFYLFILLQLVALQLILIGLLAEMIMRIYYESQNKKTYVMRQEPKPTRT